MRGYLRFVAAIIRMLWTPGISRTLLRRHRGHAFETFSIIQGNRFLSRDQTFRLINAFTEHFRHAGVQPSHHVAVCMPLCPEYLINVLSLLKLGCVVIPLNPDIGLDRLNMILEESQADLLLTSGKHKGINRPILDLEEKKDWPRQPLAISVTSELTQAMLILTSGTTGPPKCSIVDVSWLFSRVNFYARTLHLICIQPQWVTFNYVYSVVMFGGTVVLPELDDRTPLLAKVIRLLDAYEFTLMLCTPSFLEQLLDIYQQPLRSIRILLLQGELVTPAFLRRIAAFVNLDTLISMYGATELSVVLEGRYDFEAKEMLFFPLPGSDQEVCILDENHDRAAVNTKGTIAIKLNAAAEKKLKAIYFNDPQNYSANRIVRKDQTYYLTVGDLGYKDDRGRFRLVGRDDRIVKVHGQRLDLTDVERAVAAACGNSVRCYVAYFDQRFIVGFVNKEVKLSNIRASLSTLPAYARPHYLIYLPTFPLNSNHKVDLQALYAVFTDTLRDTLRQNYVAPRNDLERRLSRLWAKYFALEQVGIKDSFFDLGGSSLLAMKLLVEVRETFHVEIRPSQIFEAQTIEAMAEMLQRRDDNGRDSQELTQGIVSLASTENGRSLFCLHPTGGDITCYHALSRCLEEQCSVYGIQDIYSCQERECSIEELAGLYTKSLRTLQAHGPYQLCGWSMGGLLAFEMASQLERQGEQVAWVGLIDTVKFSGSAVHPPSGANHTERPLGRYESLRRVGLIDAFKAEQAVSTEELAERIDAEDWMSFLFAMLNKSELYRNSWSDLAAFEKWISIVFSHAKAQVEYVPGRVSAPLVVIRCPANQASWAGHSSGRVDVHEIEAEHRTVIYAPAVRKTAEILEGYLLK